jgi:hypothetical protein
MMEEHKDDFAGTIRGAFDREEGQSYLSGLADAEDEDEDTSSSEESDYQAAEYATGGDSSVEG